ncbi:protein-disulfide isomerase [Paenibacillus cellulosilyticus]|uniref:Protein-disulfide isomerase n=1 Tax=Paenibacillus cellulosilyticus TaxID=375489 RepID=A0A2V2YL36_9BACL|nr:thioredoxin domain-containing protein [Paenibacillus cellulosilyticus]PWV94259.1 protein-disulfide isomerase [Paenibacillus cellulosilyticus]QKS44252.1 DsbA family protein [Paenibacillus cellulosilyticus]
MGQAVSKSTYKQNRKDLRIRSKERQKKVRTLMWASGGILLVAIILLFALAPKPDPADFDYANLPTLGSQDAKVKIVEFGDFKCPACQQFATDVKPELIKEYIDKGIVSLSFMNYHFIGPDSKTAALAGLAVYHQSNDEFWKYYQALYDKQPDESEQWATVDYLVQLAKDEKLNIDYDKLRSDIENETYAKELSDQMSRVPQLGITGTPTLFVNGTKVGGSDAMNYEPVKAAIEKALKEVDEAGQ